MPEKRLKKYKKLFVFVFNSVSKKKKQFKEKLMQTKQWLLFGKLIFFFYVVTKTKLNKGKERNVEQTLTELSLGILPQKKIFFQT